MAYAGLRKRLNAGIEQDAICQSCCAAQLMEKSKVVAEFGHVARRNSFLELDNIGKLPERINTRKQEGK